MFKFIYLFLSIYLSRDIVTWVRRSFILFNLLCIVKLFLRETKNTDNTYATKWCTCILQAKVLSYINVHICLGDSSVYIFTKNYNSWSRTFCVSLALEGELYFHKTAFCIQKNVFISHNIPKIILPKRILL